MVKMQAVEHNLNKRNSFTSIFKDFANVLVTLSDIERLFSRTALIDCICSKEKPAQSKILQQGPFAPILACHIRQVLVHYLSSVLTTCDKQVATFINQVLESSPSLQLVQKKNRTEKIVFMTTTCWIVLAVRWLVKYFFSTNFPIFRKSLN